MSIRTYGPFLLYQNNDLGCSIESSRDSEKQDGIVVLISICAEVVATVLMCKGREQGRYWIWKKRETHREAGVQLGQKHRQELSEEGS